MTPCENLCLVSQFAVEEYEVLQDTLNLERDLRTEAENFARVVRGFISICSLYDGLHHVFVSCSILTSMHMVHYLFSVRWW